MLEFAASDLPSLTAYLTTEVQRLASVILAGTELPLLLRTSAFEGVEMLDTTRLHVDSLIETLLG